MSAADVDRLTNELAALKKQLSTVKKTKTRTKRSGNKPKPKAARKLFQVDEEYEQKLENGPKLFQLNTKDIPLRPNGALLFDDFQGGAFGKMAKKQFYFRGEDGSLKSIGEAKFVPQTGVDSAMNPVQFMRHVADKEVPFFLKQ
jgi:hypothetical protein